MIFETLVSTLDAAGRPNVAPMGVGLEGDAIVLRPFRSALTCVNLEALGEGVVNLTDDVLLFARCALQSHVPPFHPAAKVRGIVLDDACSWREFVVAEKDLTAERALFRARIVARGQGREFLGFNRAQHAVVEATILATRRHLLERESILDEMRRLEPLVAKTGGAREREAWSLVADMVRP